MSSFSIDYGQVSDMSDSSSETETRKASKSSCDTDSTGGDSITGSLLKKGPWTAAEDAILAAYVTKHGEGNWNAVQKHSGLSRCGKSCRLRWANHLRPDLKKGAFTPEEEHLIIELHAKMGNKWARMAAELPGRTDNEIKNYWNTRIKRLQRAGLPIYPPDVCMLAMNENQQSEDAGSGSPGDRFPETSQANHFDIPAIEFKGTPSLLDLPASCIPPSCIPPSCILNNNMSLNSHLGFMLPNFPQKRLRETDTQFPSSVSSFDQYDDGYRCQPFWSSSCNPDLPCPVEILPGSHALINGNNSSSQPISVAMKSELPSLQYSATQVGSWGRCSPLPSLDSADTLIQSPLGGFTQSNCPSPRNSGLLEAIVYESQSLNSPKNPLYPQISDTSTADGLVSETKCGGFLDPLSPLSQSVASVFIDYNPANGSSSEYPKSAEAVQGFKCAQEDFPSSQLEDLRPDLLFDSFWVENRTLLSKDQCITGDVGAIFCDALNTEYENFGSTSAELNQSIGHGSSV